MTACDRRLSKITNETERAQAGNELFGKGYAKLAPLIGHTKDEYEKMLGSVEKGQVITESEAKSAEQMRLAQDKLKDALGEVALAVGLTPELLPMVISVTLAHGAVRLSRKDVIVKQLSAVHDLGSMDVLCTDKTGTLT